MDHRRLGPLAAVAALAVGLDMGSAQAFAQPQQQTAPPRREARTQSVVVHLTKAPNQDPHAVFMALSMANALQRAGAPVTLFLDLEGVRLADSLTPSDFRMGKTSAAELFDNFVNAGGRVALCSHCVQLAGMESSTLRRGANVLSDAALVRLVTGADQIIDY